jgi:hypothetical protein
MMQIVFLVSAIVSGIAMVLLLYIVLSWLRPSRSTCCGVVTVAKNLYYRSSSTSRSRCSSLIHRIYEADESFRALDSWSTPSCSCRTSSSRSGWAPWCRLCLLGATQVLRLSDRARVRIYLTAGVLTLIGIFAMRWNVVIGGQLSRRASSATPPTSSGSRRREGLLPAIL